MWKWEHIAIDFIIGLPRTAKQNDIVSVVIDKLTKTTHFLAIKTTYTSKQPADLYVKEIVKLHGYYLASYHIVIVNSSQNSSTGSRL